MKPDDIVAWGLGIFRDAIDASEAAYASTQADRDRLEHREACPAWQAGEPEQCETCERAFEAEEMDE